jgi:glycosyltransferase involved in cell wall biosynthesis
MISVVVISKDEPDLDLTLRSLEEQTVDLAGRDVACEVVVIDASAGRLDHVRAAHPGVRWVDFAAEPGAGVTIARQRNLGVATAAGDILVFTDCGCRLCPGWLAALTEPLRSGAETVVAGATLSSDPRFRLYDRLAGGGAAYVEECPTINLAILRSAVEEVGGFDESFSYGSDVDLSWRLRDAGNRIRHETSAQLYADWGGWRRQLRRSFVYGRARVRLYRRHPHRVRRLLQDDPVTVLWPLYLLGLPIALKRPAYLLLLAIPALRARRQGPVRVVVDHAVYGAGVLRELVRQ